MADPPVEVAELFCVGLELIVALLLDELSVLQTGPELSAAVRQFASADAPIGLRPLAMAIIAPLTIILITKETVTLCLPLPLSRGATLSNNQPT